MRLDMTDSPCALCKVLFIRIAREEDKRQQQKENLQGHAEMPHLTQALPVCARPPQSLPLAPIWACELASDTSCAYASPAAGSQRRTRSKQLPLCNGAEIPTVLKFSFNCGSDLGEGRFGGEGSYGS